MWTGTVAIATVPVSDRSATSFTAMNVRTDESSFGVHR
jgi:hypothetical protein